MIRIIREGSTKYPWILKLIVGAIAITFVIGMGFGFEASQSNSIATVGDYKISREEYFRAKKRVSRFYQDQLKDEDVKDETIQQMALENLVNSKSWQVLADEFQLSVSAQELHDAIVNQKDFQKDEVFDAQYYQRLLAANRMTPNKYEQQRHADLLMEKARLIVSEVTTLTPAELQEVKDLTARQTLEGAEPDPNVSEQIRLQLLMQKKQRAMQAFQTELRARGNVTINHELL